MTYSVLGPDRRPSCPLPCPARTWGLLFLLSPADQRQLLTRIAGVLAPGGRLLFTAPALPLIWRDAMTGLPSQSLGAPAYRHHLTALGLTLLSESEDEGQNHYFAALRPPPSSPP